MFRVTVLYPRSEYSFFDIDYYKSKHVELVRRELEAYGILALEWDDVIGGRGGSSPPFHLASHQIWRSRADFQAAIDDGVLSRIAEDVPNFYNEEPVIVVSNVHRHWTRHGKG